MEKPKIPNRAVKCPLCSELIQAEAVVCRFCKSKVVGPDGQRISSESVIASFSKTSEKKEGEVSLGKAMLANLFFPGMGSWRLGGKFRGAIIFGTITLCIILISTNYISVINSEINEAMDEGGGSGLETKIAGLGSNWWGVLSFLIYGYSFIDVYLIYREKNR